MTATFSQPSTRSQSPANRVRSVNLAGPVGRLEAVLNEGASGATCAALVCHPHPLGGGTLHNKVVYHAMKVLNAAEWGLGFPVLRFNFRGTGLSEGVHDGAAEVDDVNAALDWLENEFKLPLIVAGFSFGAAMAMRACCNGCEHRTSEAGARRVRALVALGLPTHAQGRSYRYPFLRGCTTPKLFISGDNDQFAPAAELHQVFASASSPKHVVLLPGADHFFARQLEPMQQALARWLKEHAL